MDDYISREAARDLMYQRQEPLDEYMLDSIPAADVRPVVLCRDCVHFTAYSVINTDGTGKCGLCGKRPIGFIVDEYDFCSSGERSGAKIDGVEIPQKHGRLADLDKIEETMRIKCEEAKQKWRDSYKVISNEYDEGYMDGWQAAFDELQKQEPFISADQANQEG